MGKFQPIEDFPPYATSWAGVLWNGLRFEIWYIYISIYIYVYTYINHIYSMYSSVTWIWSTSFNVELSYKYTYILYIYTYKCKYTYMYVHIYIYVYISIYVHILHLESRWCNSSLCPLLKYHSWEWLDNYLHLGEDPEVHCNKLTWQCTNHHLIKKIHLRIWFLQCYTYILYISLLECMLPYQPCFFLEPTCTSLPPLAIA